MQPLNEVVSAFDQKIKFTVGRAGTGKSTVLANIVTNNDMVLVPTHKAASVLRAKGLKNVVTIHSVLKLVPHLDQNYNPTKNHKMQRLRRMGNIELEDIKIIYIDEYSMISTKIFELLLGALPSTAIVHMFGDSYQLPPIDGEPIYPLDYSEDIKTLNHQYRAEAPEIVETFERYAMFIEDGSEQNLKLNPLIKKGTLDSFDPETDRILAYTNAKVQELNIQAASILGLASTYIEGDSLSLNQIPCEWVEEQSAMMPIYPKCVSKGVLMSAKDLAIASSKISKEIAKWGSQQYLDIYKVGKVSIEGVVYKVWYDTNYYATQLKLKKEVNKYQSMVHEHNDIPLNTELKDWCRANPKKIGVRGRAKAWSHYIAHNSLVFSLQRPFATTIHKAQGAEFSKVFIAHKDIQRAVRNGYYVQYARLMYVALSRAINKIIIIK